MLLAAFFMEPYPGALAVSLNITFPTNNPHLPEELRRLRRYLSNSVRLLVGGNGAWGYREVLNEIGTIQLGSLGELRQELDAVRAPPQALRPTMAQRVHFAPKQEGEVRVQPDFDSNWIHGQKSIDYQSIAAA